MKKAAPKITNIKMILIEVDVTSKLGGIGYPLKNDIVAFLSTKKTLRAFVRRKIFRETSCGQYFRGLVAETGFEPPKAVKKR